MGLILQLAINALITGSIYALVAVGLSLSYLSFRVLNFAFGQTVMVGAYLYYLCYSTFGLTALQSICVLALVAPFFSTVVYYLFIKPFQGHAPLLGFTATLALGLMLEAAVAMLFGVDVKNVSSSLAEQPFFSETVHMTALQALMVGLSVVFLLLVSAMLQQTPIGRRLRASFESPKMSQASGISIIREGLISFSISTFLAFTAGVCLAFETNIQPWMGQLIGIKGFAAMVLGGLTNLWGALIGAFLLAGIEHFGIGLEFGNFSIPAGYKDAFSFLIILFVLMFFPTGIFSGRLRRV